MHAHNKIATAMLGMHSAFELWTKTIRAMHTQTQPSASGCLLPVTMSTSHHRVHCGCCKQQEQGAADVVDCLFTDVLARQRATCYCKCCRCRMSCSGPDSNTDRVLHTTDSMAAHGSTTESATNSSMLVPQYSAPPNTSGFPAGTVYSRTLHPLPITLQHLSTHAAPRAQLPYDQT